jgi:hypothetical protein
MLRGDGFLLRQGMWFVVLLMALVSALGLCWLALASQHYGFSLWYDWLDIGAHIQRYAPRNYFIAGLQDVDHAEHIRLFNAISEAVHSSGAGLANIYFDWHGKMQPLLRVPEIEHLQDVANLVDVMRLVTWGATGLAIAGCVFLRARPVWKVQLLMLGIMALVISAVVLILGPKAVFYQMHVWVFPPGHQWFFYYQESLMSTLMKAPDLFGAIAVAILVPGLLLFGVLLFILGRVYAPQKI